MTLQKHLKERVRSRMQRTGESYTTARRHILNQRFVAVLPKSTPPALRWHFPGAIPATTALRVLLTHAGVRNPATGEPFSEPLLFLLAGGIGIGVCSFFYEKANHATFFVAGRHSWFDDLTYFHEAIERFGMKPIIQETSGKKAAEKQLRETLNEGSPCIAWVDMALLPHRAMPKEYEGGGYHVVTAYRIDGDKALIGDMTDEPIEISLEALAASRERIKKQKNRLLRLEAFDGKLDLKRLVQDGLAACAHGLTEASMGPIKTSFRLEALKQLAERLNGSKDKERWERVFATPENLWRGLTGMYEFIESYGTGGGLCRTLFADGMAEAGDLLKRPSLSALAQQYAELGTQWSELAEAALPSQMAPFAKAKELFQRRAELLHTGGPSEAIAKVWSELAALQQHVKADFPLSDNDIADLRASLQDRVRALYRDEVDAHEALQAVLK